MENDAEKFVQEYLKDNKTVQEFITAEKVYSGLFGFIPIVALISLLMWAGLDGHTITLSGNTILLQWTAVIPLILLLLGILGSGTLSVNTQMDHTEAFYHYLAASIREFENENYNECLSELGSAAEIFDSKLEPSIHPTHKHIISEYLNRLESMDELSPTSKIFHSTFPSIIPLLASEMYGIENSEAINELSSLQIQEELPKSNLGVVITGLTGIARGFASRGASLYILVALIGITTFYAISSELGMFIAVIGVPLAREFSDRREGD